MSGKVTKHGPYQTPGQGTWFDWLHQYGPTVGRVARHYLRRKFRDKGPGGYTKTSTLKRSFETTGMGTKDMIRGPHYKKIIGKRKRINIPRQLHSLVDDTKVFKQQFKLKIASGDGLRQWAQIVTRYRATPGKLVDAILKPHGETLSPNVISFVKQPGEAYTGLTEVQKYRVSCPPMVEGKFEGSGGAMVLNSTYHFGDSPSILQNNLFFLNMPLTYLEQDMYNMGLGPGLRRYTRAMDTTAKELTLVSQSGDSSKVQTDLNENGELLTSSGTTTTGTDRSRTTLMKPVTHPAYKTVEFEMQNAPLNQDLVSGVPTKLGLPMKYDFRMGWGINQLDYNVMDNSMGADTPSVKDPQWIKTNNTDATIATITDGEISFTFNNLGDTQAYVTTLVVVQKHVDTHYWSMPTALTDTYLKCAQEFITSGEWSITNNITPVSASKSSGDMINPYMYISHPSIKPYGKVPTKFLEDFNKHYVIKSQTTMKLGIGERQSCKIHLGGLQYSADSIAMDKSLHDRNAPIENTFYHPAAMNSEGTAMADLSTDVKAAFPLCCQQGTTHFLFGIQGFSTPYVKKTKNGSPDHTGELDVKECQGRWAVPALIDISGTYKEVIKPLTTGKHNTTPVQRCLTVLPATGDTGDNNNMYPIVTTMPRIRTTEDSAMEVTKDLT